VAGGDSQQVARWETDLQETGRMAVSPEQLAALQKDFSGGWIDDVETKAVINHVYNDFGYLLDPHTAVAYGVYLNQRHLPDRQGSRHTVIMATAHPFKFPPVICQALALEQPADPYAMLAQISDCTGMSLPGPLAELQRKPVRFGDSINKEDMKEAVLSFVDTISSND
jgi:threonine synthase